MAKKLYTFEDRNLDRQIQELVVNMFADLPVYASNADAIAGGLRLFQPYRTGGDPDVVCVVHSA